MSKRKEKVWKKEKIKFIYRQDEKFWPGYIEEYPEYITHGANLEELKENLKDIYKEFSSGNIPNVRKTAELEIN
ncbi:MAG: type II toxin-antitoxin system HicB family antitoxin [Ignavibacteriales bacterium]|nr:type II toxin-antitoxin system HicB family antitoxin [Ignavibacteriales bacterium]